MMRGKVIFRQQPAACAHIRGNPGGNIPFIKSPPAFARQPTQRCRQLRLAQFPAYGADIVVRRAEDPAETGKALQVTAFPGIRARVFP